MRRMLDEGDTMQFNYMKLTVMFKELEDEIHPYFLGSFIRGNFGMYLKKTVCPFSFNKNCHTCLIRKKCFYAGVFETQSDANTPGKMIPPPFVIDMPDYQYNEAEKHTNLSFDMLLFGPALENFEFFILVFSEMGKHGLGKKRVKCKRTIIKDSDGRQVYASGIEEILCSPKVLSFGFNPVQPVNRLKVFYRSPLRLQKDKKLINKPDFEILIRSALRRLVYLEEFYGTSTKFQFKEIIEECAGIKTISNNLQWVHQVRYSNRKRVRMNLGGIMGHQEFAGNIPPMHVNLMRFASIFHLGKSSTFGLGKVSIEQHAASGGQGEAPPQCC